MADGADLIRPEKFNFDPCCQVNIFFKIMAAFEENARKTKFLLTFLAEPGNVGF